MEKKKWKISHHEVGKHSVMKQTRINYFSFYSLGERTSFPFLSNKLHHLIEGVRLAGNRKKKESKGEMKNKRRRDGIERDTKPDRDKASVCHVQKRCLVGRLRVPSHDKKQKQEGCRPDQVGAA